MAVVADYTVYLYCHILWVIADGFGVVTEWLGGAHEWQEMSLRWAVANCFDGFDLALGEEAEILLPERFRI